MFLWTKASTRRADGDFDFDVIAHEFYHGVSNRSVGKGEAGCLGVTLVGESGGQGEGWSDTIAESMSDDDVTAEYPVGELDIGIRRLPKTNYRWSYQAINQRGLFRRDRGVPDAEGSVGTGSVPFAVHRTGEVWSATLWDMRELLIMKENVVGHTNHLPGRQWRAGPHPWTNLLLPGARHPQSAMRLRGRNEKHRHQRRGRDRAGSAIHRRRPGRRPESG